MKYEDIASKTKDELAKTLLELKKDQMELRFKHAGGQVDKTHEIRGLRRDIARVQTAMNAPESAKKAVAPKKETKKASAKKTEKAA
jgi:large subunit ribosomal protein L29